ncbi:MAG TPA: PQQ-binding-like beta-propeller repeat protein [Pirellulales bacterium]|nr:PQQ-binding-like beta-propeller repeat protein [Pirellulales bacterium]
MSPRCLRPRTAVFRLLAAAFALLWVLLPASMRAQSAKSTLADLSAAVTLDEPDSATRAILERVKEAIQNAQADEAVENLRQVMEQAGEKVLRASDDRAISVRDYCQLQLVASAAHAPEILKLYRSRVDAVAKKAYDDGLQRRDKRVLRQVAEHYFASHWGDDALFALGEIALEEGAFTAARHDWEMLDPQWQSPDGRPLWLSLRERSLQRAGPDSAPEPAPATAAHLATVELRYPDTDLALADIRARLVLVSILEGNFERARLELAYFQKLHPEAMGRLAGKEVNYAAGLTAQLALAEQSPPPARSADWTTFAGDFTRNHVLPNPLPLGPVCWPAIHLGEPQQADIHAAQFFMLPQRRPGEDVQELLSYHPIVAENLLLYCNEDQVFAFSLATGKPAWPGAKGKPLGEIYNDRDDATPRPSRQMLGVPRFTLTAQAGRLIARLGSAVTIGTLDAPPRSGNKLVILDLKQQGKKLREIVAAEKWAFEGTPVADHAQLYVAMRYSDVRPQCFVAAYDLDSGKLLWRRLVCAAETLSQGQLEEATYNLLTLVHDTLYLNTNSGVVAALNKRDGHVNWLTFYPRAKRGDLSKNSAHYYRDLNPCVFAQSSLYVAPADFEGVLALDAATGTILWESQQNVGEAMHLLGVAGGHVIASGEKLWWLRAASGLVVQNFPEGNTPPNGFGRGLLAGETIYWPTHSAIERFSARSGERQKPIRLDAETPAIRPGNLIAADSRLIVAGGTELNCIGPARAPAAPPELTLRTSNGTAP